MDDGRRLLAYEDIRTLLARRVRCIDEKDWAGFADCYTDDAVSYSFATPDSPGDATVGNTVIAERVAAALDGVTTVHQIHLPEIELISDDTATGIVPLNDILSSVRDGKRTWMRAYGHYRQTYRRVDGRWRISEHRLTRLYTEHGEESVGTEPGATWR